MITTTTIFFAWYTVLHMLFGLLSWGYIYAWERPNEPPFHLLTFIRWMMVWEILVVIGIIKKDKYIRPRYEDWKKWILFHFTELPKEKEE